MKLQKCKMISQYRHLHQLRALQTGRILQPFSLFSLEITSSASAEQRGEPCFCQVALISTHSDIQERINQVTGLRKLFAYDRAVTSKDEFATLCKHQDGTQKKQWKNKPSRNSCKIYQCSPPNWKSRSRKIKNSQLGFSYRLKNIRILLESLIDTWSFLSFQAEQLSTELEEIALKTALCLIWLSEGKLSQW